MRESVTTYLERQIVEEDIEFTFAELCRASGASEDQLTMWISEGALEPQGPRTEEWWYARGTMPRAYHSPHRLPRDLEINAPGIALALDLLDEIDALRARSGRSYGRNSIVSTDVSEIV